MQVPVPNMTASGVNQMVGRLLAGPKETLADFLTPGRLLSAEVVSVFQNRAVLSLARGILLEVRLEAALAERQRVSLQVQPPAEQPARGNQETATVLLRLVDQEGDGEAGQELTGQARLLPRTGGRPASDTLETGQRPVPSDIPTGRPTPPPPPRPIVYEPPPGWREGEGARPPAQPQPATPPGSAPQGAAPAAWVPTETVAPAPVVGEAGQPAPPAESVPAQQPAGAAPQPSGSGAPQGAPPAAPEGAPLAAPAGQPAVPGQPSAPPGAAAPHAAPSTSPQGAPAPGTASPAPPQGAPSQAAPAEATTAAPAPQATASAAPPPVQSPAPPTQTMPLAVPGEMVAWVPLPLPGGGQGWAQLKVEEQKRRNARKGSERYYQVRIWWETPELGAVQVMLDAAPEGRLVGLFTVAAATLRAAIEERLPQLSEALEQAGYPAAQLGARVAKPGEQPTPPASGSAMFDRRV